MTVESKMYSEEVIFNIIVHESATFVLLIQNYPIIAKYWFHTMFWLIVIPRTSTKSCSKISWAEGLVLQIEWSNLIVNGPFSNICST